MKDLLKRFCNLLSIKSIVTLVLVCVFAFLVVKQFPIPQELQALVTVVIGFYFGTQAKKE